MNFRSGGGACAFGRDFVLVERALRTERAGLASLAGALAGMLATGKIISL